MGYDAQVIAFHAGQREVQDEANSRLVADLLAGRSKGPDDEIPVRMRSADVLLLAMADAGGSLQFQAASGAPPLIHGETSAGMKLPAGLHLPSLEGALVGGMAIDLAQRVRSRLNGRLLSRDGVTVFQAAETFANCRKYVAPSVALEAGLHIGPVSREDVTLQDAGLARLVATVETAFVASLGVEGMPDVSHRGGPAGFIVLDGALRFARWRELIGNGMFKTAGNIRATGTTALLLLDVESGDAYELAGRAEYHNLLRYDEPRERGLWPSQEDFPSQGEIVLQVERATRLPRLVNPRRRLLDEAKVTSCSPPEDQVPR
jgi:hypothetical protein